MFRSSLFCSVLPLLLRQTNANACGHVFILHTDLRYLACDSWLLPVGSSMHIDAQWGLHQMDVPRRPDGWGSRVRLIQSLSESTRAGRHRSYAHPQPWLAHVIGDELSVEDLLVPLRQYLAEASAGLEHSRFGRAMPLLAVPIFGAGLATENFEGSQLSGDLVKAVYAELRAFTATHAVDCALCTLDEAAFGAALNARRREDETFQRHRRAPEGTDEARYASEVTRLAELFDDGRCSLFLGAGISVNAGLPSWTQLLEKIAAELDYPEEDREALLRLNPLEAASVLEGAAGGDVPLKALTARIVGAAKRHSLQHALLAGLPFKGCVTTNYDDLLERAVRHAGDDLAVLPAEVGTVVDRWLLKLHGDVHSPASIVLTRADYTRFSSQNAANEGVLQGLLLTQHVLFCGFSMRDENWCRLVDAVRSPLTRSLGNGGAGDGGGGQEAQERGGMRLGTVLSLQEDRLFDSLWDGLLHVSAFDRLGTPLPEGAEAGGAAAVAWHARSLEIFLDHVASAVESQRCRILLNPKYDALLSPRSLALQACMRAFLDSLDDEAKRSGAFKQVQQLLLDMGLRTEEAQRLADDPTIEGPYRRRLSKLRAHMPSHTSQIRRR